MKKLNTKFGTIFIEDFECDYHLPALREEDDRIKIFDSDEKYLGYYTLETISTREEYNELCRTIENADTIEKLIDCVADFPYMFYSNSFKETIAGMILYDYFDTKTIKLLKDNFGDWTDDVILSHDYTNRIGNNYIVFTDI